MRTIKVMEIEGLEDVDENSTVEMYTYQEMRINKNYCRGEADKDEFMNNMSSPVGWVVQQRLDIGWIFIPVLASDKYEEVEIDPMEVAFMHQDLPHSGLLN
jgi:hypothetical protein